MKKPPQNSESPNSATFVPLFKETSHPQIPNKEKEIVEQLQRTAESCAEFVLRSPSVTPHKT